MASLMCGWMEALDNDLEGEDPSSSAQPAHQQQLTAAGGRQEYSEFGFLKVRKSTHIVAHQAAVLQSRA